MGFTHVVLSALLCFSPAVFAESDEALVAAAEQLIKEGATTQDVSETEVAAAPEAKAADDKKELKESEIPIVIKPKTANKEESNILWRVVASFGLLTAVAGSMYFAAKKWGRAKDKGGQKARIEMMHQFHLGPKKSVALIRVAGEALLIGVTDQNINMLKPVTLIDEELEQVMGKDFNNFLEDEFSVEDVRTAMRARA